MRSTLQDIQHEADFRLLDLDKLFVGPVSLKRLRFTPGESFPIKQMSYWPVTHLNGDRVRPYCVMTLYLESGETRRLQHVAEVRFRLEKERDFRASMYKLYRHGANFVDGLDTVLSVTSLGLAATGVGLLSTIFAVPVVLGL